MILALAIEENEVRKRFLNIAYDMLAIHDDEIHPDYLLRWNQIILEITKDGSVEETLKKRRNRMFRKVAENMVELYLEMRSKEL